MKNDIILNIGSMTRAIKAKRILNREGIGISIIKLESKLYTSGCGYGIVFSEADEYTAIRILKENKIPYSVHEKNK